MSKEASGQLIVIGFDRKPTDNDLKEIADAGGMRGEKSVYRVQSALPEMAYAAISIEWNNNPPHLPRAFHEQFKKTAKETDE